MRIIFMGTPEFAVASLAKLVDMGEEVVAVVTSTDKLGGRGGKQLLESAVKKYALSKNIPVLQPERLKAKSFLNELKSYNADVQFVVAFRMLPEIVWAMPKLGTFNLHGSLLPKYRGAAPINWAIIRGEKETGVTSFKLKHEIDTGDVVLRRSLPILEDDTAGTLHDKMMQLGAEVVYDTCQTLKSDHITFIPQSEEEATSAPKLFHEDCEINFNQATLNVYNFIRGLSPYPSAYTTIDGLQTKIISCKPVIEAHTNAIGSVSMSKKQIKLFCLDGYIDVATLKMEGKREMNSHDFLNGYIKPN